MTEGTPTIHVVDDEDEVRRALQEMLTVFGYTVVAHAAAEALLASINPRQYGCIIADVRMPGLDGIDVLKTIRKHPKHKDLPVIVYSALSDPDTIDNAMKYGAQNYLVKSKADFQEIRNCIENHLGGS